MRWRTACADNNSAPRGWPCSWRQRPFAPRFTPNDSDLARIAVHASLPLIAASLDASRAGAANLFALLTPRRREVLLLLNEGLSTKQIAERLALTPNSVQTYTQALCKRLGVRGQLEAIALCNRKGWLVGG